ncbi:MAG: class I SAM-dependent methyltransferase [Pseudomonadota bacterium]
MSAAIEIINKTRFNFGDNWQEFYARINEDRINLAIESLQALFPDYDFSGKRFLDVGCGSGLFSLAAQRLGAEVHSFDYDANSVACTEQLKKQFGDTTAWTIERGSVLDQNFIDSLGRFDLVYSWGVLHHTGEMMRSLEIISKLVDAGGRICVALYNDQGPKSTTWLQIKKLYNKLPEPVRPGLVALCWLRLWGPTMIKDLLHLKPLNTWREYPENSIRGMSAWHDLVDWVGGLPFEVAKPEVIIELFFEHGFALEKLTTCAGGIGCNQYVFRAP